MDAALVIDNFPAARRTLRVACVTETWPPEVNGVASTMARVVEGLNARGHGVQLVRPRQKPEQEARTPVQPKVEEVLTRGLKIPRYPELRMGVPSKRALVQLWSLQRPDVVHIATEGALGWSALQAAQHLKLPVASDFRTNFHAYSSHYGLGWLNKPIMAYLRKFHNRCDCTMVPTEGLRRELAERGFRGLSVVSRGVDTIGFAPAFRSAALRAEWGATPDDLVVACVGRVAAEKNLNLLFEAFERIRQAVPRAKLVVVGDGPARESLQQRFPFAIFAGQRRGAELAAHYASADLFLFPSLTETFGNVTTEALASGLPVVAFDYAAAAELIQDGVHGLRAPCDDNAAFCAAAVELATRLANEPAERGRMSANARTLAEGLSWERIVARFEDALVMAMERPGIGARLQPRMAKA
ncbi:MAG: glycosyltransferase family 1 protein [Pelomonas sp.]|nr:glycosyltransferase family 1 protein [Roseateles sp.]